MLVETLHVRTRGLPTLDLGSSTLDTLGRTNLLDAFELPTTALVAVQAAASYHCP